MRTVVHIVFKIKSNDPVVKLIFFVNFFVKTDLGGGTCLFLRTRVILSFSKNELEINRSVGYTYSE